MPTRDSRLEASEKLLRELLVRFRHSFFCYVFRYSCYGGGSRDSWKSGGRGSWASPGQSRAVDEDRNSQSLCDYCVTMVYSGTALVWRALARSAGCLHTIAAAPNPVARLALSY